MTSGNFTSKQDFYRAWSESETVNEIAEKLGMEYRAVYNRVNRWLEAGIDLHDPVRRYNQQDKDIQDED